MLQTYISNSDSIWHARSLFQDELSRKLFDDILVLRAVSHSKFFLAKPIHGPMLDIECRSPFRNPQLPNNYLGEKLSQFRFKSSSNAYSRSVNLITNDDLFDAYNIYRQYFFRRDGVEISPQSGDIVYDCGACIGDSSVVFASAVGLKGTVHCFDPVPLHSKFCNLQKKLNPELGSIIQIHECAVTNKSVDTSGDIKDSKTIAPGGLSLNSYKKIRLDDFNANHEPGRVDYIKMDIEGAEQKALVGASNIISSQKPKLAICLYHDIADYWEIPIQINNINPDYQLYFDHHSPIEWESVCYAIHEKQIL